MHNLKSILYNYLGTLLVTIALPFLILYFLFIVVGLQDDQIAILIQNKLIGLLFAACLLLVPVYTTFYFKRKQKLETQQYINISILRYIIAF